MTAHVGYRQRLTGPQVMHYVEADERQLPTPTLYEDLARRLAPHRPILFGAVGVFYVLGFIVIDSAQVLWGIAGLVWGLLMTTYWFHPKTGLGPNSEVVQRGMAVRKLLWSWPAALGLTAWFIFNLWLGLR